MDIGLLAINASDSVKTCIWMIDVALTIDVSTIKVQVFPASFGLVIHSTEPPRLSTILQYVYKQGLVVESMKY